MYSDQPLLPDALKQAHAAAWQTIARPGDHFTGAERVAFLQAARDSMDCDLCLERKTSLSPTAVAGEHTHDTALSSTVVDVIHRLRSDPGRLTRRWFDSVIRHISPAAYVEIVSVVCSGVIIDTLHNALGNGIPALPPSQSGTPSPRPNPNTVDGGAWVPMLAAERDMADTGLPRVPNIARSLGLVPAALDLFFATFRPHYALRDLPLSITQSQAEFVAARVSALNECFY